MNVFILLPPITEGLVSPLPDAWRETFIEKEVASQCLYVTRWRAVTESDSQSNLLIFVTNHVVNGQAALKCSFISPDVRWM